MRFSLAMSWFNKVRMYAHTGIPMSTHLCEKEDLVSAQGIDRLVNRRTNDCPMTTPENGCLSLVSSNMAVCKKKWPNQHLAVRRKAVSWKYRSSIECGHGMGMGHWAR